MENHYGKIIRQEREAANMTKGELASLLLMSPEYLEAVEREEDTLSDFRLNMAANTFHISKSGLVRGMSLPQMDAGEINKALETISKEIAQLKQMQALLEEQIYDEKVRNAGEENSLEERYTMAMELAGYEPARTEPDSMATVTFKTRNSDRTVAFDGWQSVGYYLEDVVLDDEAEAKRFDELIHPRGRIQFVTQNLDGEGLGEENDINIYPDMETALNAYLNAGAVDGKAIGFRMVGEDSSLHVVKLAHFDSVNMNSHIHDLSHIKKLVPNVAVNELEQIESMRKTVFDELIKDNAYMKIQNTFNDISMRAKTDIVRQNSEWGAWFGRIANSHRPQDYVNIDITGYSKHHEVIYTVDIIHANEVVDSRRLAIDTDENNFADTMEKAYATASSEFTEFLKEAVEKLSTDLEYPMTEYTPYTENSVEKHIRQLYDLGYFVEEKEERIFYGEAEEEILQEREIKM